VRLPLHSAIPSLYLFLCIVLGGSAQGWWTNISIQIAGIAMMAWAGICSGSQPGTRRPITMYIILLAGLSFVLLQLVPLPPSVWTRLPGRETISAVFSQLGYAYPALPVSETPQQSVLTLVAAIPAISGFVATERLRPSPRWLALAIIAATMLAILVGALQVAGGPDSPARFYPISNSGAVGFFANQNHMATLLLIAIPLIALLIGSREEHGGEKTGVYGLTIILLAFILVGIALNGSLAAAILAAPVLLASIGLVPAWARWRRLAIPCAIIALLAGIAFLASKPIAGTATAEESTAFTSRTQIWYTTSEVVRQTFPIGTGLGSFQQVYRQHEDPASVTNEYVNHAHNDYLELVLELGAPGLLLLLAFIVSWGSTAVRIWSSTHAGRYARAATIVTAAILAHSFVDFPLRTGAICAIFGASIALMGTAFETGAVPGRGKLRPARHVKIA
jgi:O-antigen ligase